VDIETRQNAVTMLLLLLLLLLLCTETRNATISSCSSAGHNNEMEPECERESSGGMLSRTVS